jgi:hypothetical protein
MKEMPKHEIDKTFTSACGALFKTVKTVDDPSFPSLGGGCDGDDNDNDYGNYSHRICQPNEIKQEDIISCLYHLPHHGDGYGNGISGLHSRIVTRNQDEGEKKKKKMGTHLYHLPHHGYGNGISGRLSSKAAAAKKTMKTKIYGDKSLRNRKRKWRLKLMDGLHAGQVETEDNGTYSHRICPTNIKDEELSKKGRGDDPWPDAFPALVRQLPLVEKKKKMRADQGLRGVEKRKKKRNNQIEPPFPADCKLCVVMSTLHSNDDDEQKAGSRGRRKPEAVERDGTKKKKKGTHFSRERPYSL